MDSWKIGKMVICPIRYLFMEQCQSDDLIFYYKVQISLCLGGRKQKEIET